MSHSFDMLGLDTLELIGLGSGRGIEFDAIPLERRGGPRVNYMYMGGKMDAFLYLYPEHLKLLYERFREANPNGVVFGRDSFYYAYAPAGLSRRQVEILEESEKLFPSLFLSSDEDGYPHARKYLPEIFVHDVVERMAADPWLHSLLLSRAEDNGRVPYGVAGSSRWSEEWRAYCDELIKSGKWPKYKQQLLSGEIS